jgi:hypothetical protein
VNWNQAPVSPRALLLDRVQTQAQAMQAGGTFIMPNILLSG